MIPAEDTKLEAILPQIETNIQQLLLEMVFKYRVNLTKQLNKSKEIEDQIVRKMSKLQLSNNYINLVDFKPFKTEIVDDISTLMFKIVKKVKRIELKVDEHTRLGVVGSPHKEHYPLLYKMMNLDELKREKHAAGRQQEASTGTENGSETKTEAVAPKPEVTKCSIPPPRIVSAVSASSQVSADEITARFSQSASLKDVLSNISATNRR